MAIMHLLITCAFYTLAYASKVNVGLCTPGLHRCQPCPRVAVMHALHTAAVPTSATNINLISVSLQPLVVVADKGFKLQTGIMCK